MEKNKIIEITHLSKTYNGISYVINNLNFSVKKGDYIQILGQSGSGKSTLLNIIGLIYNEFEGAMNICGFDIKKLKDQQVSLIRNKHIGFIFQAYNLIPSMTVKENIMLPMIYSRIMPDDRYMSYITYLMDNFEITKLSEKKIQFLSGGEKQRVAIARALSLKPDLILADEPTGNLDSNNSGIIFSALSKLHDDGVTVILVTHNNYADIGPDVKYNLIGGTLLC